MMMSEGEYQEQMDDPPPLGDTNIISPQDYVFGLEAEIARLRMRIDQLMRERESYGERILAAEAVVRAAELKRNTRYRPAGRAS